MKVAAKIAVIAIAGFVGARAARACSCFGPDPICAAYPKTALLFLGHVVGIDPGKETAANGPGLLVRFEVIKAYRGDAGRQVVIETAVQSSACGFGFAPGHDYLVYGFTGPGGEMRADKCTRTHEVTSRADDEDMRWLEGLAKAPPGASIFGTVKSLRPAEGGGYDTAELPGIAVTIAGPESKTVSPDSAGKFRFDGLPPGKYVVSAAAPKGYTAMVGATATVVDRGCAEVNWITRIDGHIRGHVYLADGSPAGGVFLTLKPADLEAGKPRNGEDRRAFTDAGGSFDFGGLAEGGYVLGANVDSAPPDGKSYYRKAFFPAGIHKAEAAVLTLVRAGIVDNLRFFLPPDAAAATSAQQVTVMGYDGKPAPGAQVMAYDDLWDNSITVMGMADEHGKATLMLRPGTHYDIVAVVSKPHASPDCAGPAEKDARDQPAPLVLVASHHTGNCMVFKSAHQ